ncbi:MAG: ribose 5-phosphate isomerase B [Minicystis sp.]
MRVAIGCDHGGFELKRDLTAFLAQEGHEVLDLGTDGSAPVDYPAYAEAVGNAVLSGKAERGVLLCGSGVGASVAANKLPGIRAGLCHDSYSAHQGVEHDDMNILVMGGLVVGREVARELVHIFLTARYTGEERHQRRIDEIGDLERRYSPPWRAAVVPGDARARALRSTAPGAREAQGRFVEAARRGTGASRGGRGASSGKGRPAHEPRRRRHAQPSQESTGRR